jgi:hypothetical protein
VAAALEPLPAILAMVRGSKDVRAHQRFRMRVVEFPRKAVLFTPNLSKIDQLSALRSLIMLA